MAKVLHVVESLAAGGAERVVVEYARTHDPSRYQPEVCAVLGGGPLEAPLREAGVPVHILGRRRRFDPSAIRRLARIISGGRFDVVHNHNFAALSTGLPAAMLSGVRTVLRTEHNVAFSDGGARFVLSRLAAMREDAQIAVSGEVRRTHVLTGRIPPERFVTIMNGIASERMETDADPARVRRELGMPEDAVVCLNVGSLTPQKNRVNLLRAAVLLKDVSEIRFLVVGKGPREGELKRLAAELGLAETVHFLGERLDVAALMAACDLFVLSSDWEGLPITVLEAMAAGVPCVSTAVGGLPEVIADGESGYLVPPGDPEALAARVRELASDPDRRSRMADVAREEFGRRFTSEKMVRQTEALYDLARAGRSAYAVPGRVRVLYVIGQLGRGGAERQVVELVRRIPRDVFEPVVCCLSGPGVLGEEIEDEDIRVIYLGKSRGAMSGTSLSLMGMVRRERPAVLHSYLFSANWRCLIVGRLMRVPLVISSVRNVDIHSRLGMRLLEWALSGLWDRVIANARAVKDYVSSHHLVSADKISVIYNGVSPERTANERRTKGPVSPEPDAPKGGTVVMIASFTRKKDHGTFLKAAGIVAEQLPGTRFRLIGDGPLHSDIANEIHEMGLADAVSLDGTVNDIGPVLFDADVSVLTSLKEGCSNVILESMAAGCPLVVTDVGGNHELVGDCGCGYLVPVGDAEEIARRVAELLSDVELRARMGAAGRERVSEHFTIDKMVGKTVDFYLSALRDRVPGLREWVRFSHERRGAGAGGSDAALPEGGAGLREPVQG